MGKDPPTRDTEFNRVYPTKRSFWADSFILFSFWHGFCVGAVFAAGLVLIVLHGEQGVTKKQKVTKSSSIQGTVVPLPVKKGG